VGILTVHLYLYEIIFFSFLPPVIFRCFGVAILVNIITLCLKRLVT